MQRDRHVRAVREVAVSVGETLLPGRHVQAGVECEARGLAAA